MEAASNLPKMSEAPSPLSGPPELERHVFTLTSMEAQTHPNPHTCLS